MAAARMMFKSAMGSTGWGVARLAMAAARPAGCGGRRVARGAGLKLGLPGGDISTAAPGLRPCSAREGAKHATPAQQQLG